MGCGDNIVEPDNFYDVLDFVIVIDTVEVAEACDSVVFDNGDDIMVGDMEFPIDILGIIRIFGFF